MANIISALFDNRQDAERAVNWLQEQRIPDDAITVVGRHGEENITGRDATDGAKDAGSGLGTGIGIGAGVGALFGLAAAMIPGVGPLIAAGGLAHILGATGGLVASGAVVGATTGGLAGALSHWGLNEAEAHHYASGIEQGGTYVGVDLDRAPGDRATILEGLRRFNGRVEGPGAAATDTFNQPTRSAIGTQAPASSLETTAPATGEMRVPVMEEEANVRKEVRQAGEVAVTKNVETETQRISEPVTRTKVDVNVREVALGESVSPSATTLQPGQEIRVPIHEEQLVVEKVPQVTREVVISTGQETTHATQDVELRKERVDVHQEGDVDVDADDLTPGRRV